MTNSISDKDVEKLKTAMNVGDKKKNFKSKIQEVVTKTLGSTASANSISDKDMKMLEKSYLKDESKSLKGKAFANGGKVDFKGSF
tara:strand:- start:19 stop:273 length:255 start_codon:yes stop_codon:yes gene_type:complete